MKILITNPRIATPLVAYDIEAFANKDQIVRQIEKLLLSKSIIADKIEVLKE
jgi:hypothetical protein